MPSGDLPKFQLFQRDQDTSEDFFKATVPESVIHQAELRYHRCSAKELKADLIYVWTLSEFACSRHVPVKWQDISRYFQMSDGVGHG